MKGLDKYLTTPPDDGYDGWCDEVCNHISDDWWGTNEEWFTTFAECDKELSRLFNEGYPPIEAAIELMNYKP